MTLWTDERTEILNSNWQKYSCSQLAAMLNARFPGLGLTRNAVVGKLHRMGLRKNEQVPRPYVTKHVVRAPALPRPKPEPLGQMFKAPPRVSPSTFMPRIVETAPLNIPFEDLNGDVCKYECTNADHPADYRFCGQPSDGTSSYCGIHRRLCQIKPQPAKSRYYVRAA